MKKVISLILCALVCLGTLCSCSASKKIVLTIGEAQIDSEVFSYFFSQVYSAVESSGGNLLAKDEMVAQAVDKCCEYVSATTQFNALQLSLDTDAKMRVAKSTEDEWMLYGGYYSDIGISKQTVAKIYEVNEYRTQLLVHYFGEGSEYEVTEDEIAYYFDRTYVEFKAINGYFTTIDENGDSVLLSEDEMLAIRNDFEDKRSKLESGETFADINDGVDVESTYIAVSNPAYPEGFLEKVAELEYDKPAVIETDEYIFLVVRSDAKKGDDNYYKTYRTKYIEDLRGEMLTDMLVASAEDYSMTKNDDDLLKIAEDIISARNKRK